MLFTNATGGVEEWDAPEEAERWRRMMAWPVIPTVEDALAFAQNIEATMTVEGWDAMRAAREDFPAWCPADCVRPCRILLALFVRPFRLARSLLRNCRPTEQQ